MNSEDSFTSCQQKDDWFALTMQEDPAKHKYPSSLRFSFIEDGEAFKILGAGRKFANDSKYIEAFTVTPTKVRIALSPEVSSNSPLTLFRMRPECRLALLEYVAERPNLAAKMTVRDDEG